jgi:hypothetical protein
MLVFSNELQIQAWFQLLIMFLSVYLVSGLKTYSKLKCK